MCFRPKDKWDVREKNLVVKASFCNITATFSETKLQKEYFYIIFTYTLPLSTASQSEVISDYNKYITIYLSNCTMVLINLAIVAYENLFKKD